MYFAQAHLLIFIILIFSLVLGVPIVVALLVNSSLLVSGSPHVVWLALVVVSTLSIVAKDLADLVEGDARVLLANSLMLLIGEEHHTQRDLYWER